MCIFITLATLWTVLAIFQIKNEFERVKVFKKLDAVLDEMSKQLEE